MALSGSAKEVELRIRNIVQGPKKRPPVPLMILAAIAILSCGWLVSCQPRQAVPEVVMDIQYYDQLGKFIEVPTLAVPSGQEETAGVRAINQELAAISQRYQPMLSSVDRQTTVRCLCYPSETDRYLNLVLYQQESSGVKLTSSISSWVYDKQEKRQVTLEEALTLANTSQEELADGLLQALSLGQVGNMETGQSFAVPGIPYQDPQVRAFRICPDGQVEFYLYAVSKYQEDTPFLWREGTYRLYPPLNTGGVWDSLVPQEELISLSPPLWCQWYFEGGEPEGGYTIPVDREGQARLLLQRTCDIYNYLSSPSVDLLLSRTDGNRTLLLAQLTGTPHAAGLVDLALGVWDDEAEDFVGETYFFGGDDGRFSSWEESDGSLHLLCANSITYQGDETSNGLGYFQFKDGGLSRISQIPDIAFSGGLLDPADPDTQAMLTPIEDGPNINWHDSGEFWWSHKAVPSGAGFELYAKNPAFAPYDPAAAGETQWIDMGYVPFTNFLGVDANASEIFGAILDYYRQRYPRRTVYLAVDQPDEPQADDLRIGPAAYAGALRVGEIVAVAYQVETSSYQLIRQSADDPGTLKWYSYDPAYIVLSRSGHDGTFQRVLGTASVVGGKPVEHAIREIVYGLMDADVCLYRDGWPTPVGPGNWPDLFNPAYEEETIEVLDGWEPIYQTGDSWNRWSAEGFTALGYYSSVENTFSANTVDVTRADFYTPRGIRVGVSRAEVLDAYPEAVADNYWGKYPGEDMLYWTAWPSESELGPAILFFFEGDTVRQITLINMFD